MADIFGFLNTVPFQKRKRAFDDLDSDDAQRSIKRRPMTSLPIRSPPQSRPLSAHAALSFRSAPPGTLTPIDTSEDECSRNREREDIWRSRPSISDCQAGSDSSTSSVRVQVDDADVDTDMIMSSPTRPKIGRARSNDILSSPRRRPNLLSPPAVSVRDRVPTPIDSRFDSRLSDLPSAPRHSFPPLRTNLSPMIEQESWTGYQTLPSPADEVDMDAMIVGDQSGGDGMNGLYVSANDEVMDAENNFSMMDPRYGEDTVQELGRTARLHMGFLSGCDKCVRKVPGHYSHILWS